VTVSRHATAIGDNCVDVFIEPVRRRFAGGNAYNVAVQLARRGFATEYMGAVGNDANGSALRRVLEREHVAIERLQLLPGHTSVTKIELQEGGERVFLHEDFGVVADYEPSEDDFDRAVESDLVHGAGARDVEAFLAALYERGARVSYDFSTKDAPPDLRTLDVAFFSARPGIAPVELARHAVASGATVAVVTCGSQGSVAIEGETVEDVTALPFYPVDTTGAGDAYIASFLTERLEGSLLRECMLVATEFAAKTCLHVGGLLGAELYGETRA
jgi:fructoselysine 6-kinase